MQIFTTLRFTRPENTFFACLLVVETVLSYRHDGREPQILPLGLNVNWPDAVASWVVGLLAHEELHVKIFAKDLLH